MCIRDRKTFNQKRISRAKKFITSLSNFSELKFNSSFKNNRHVYHLLSAYYKPSKKKNRNDLIQLLYKRYGIQCATQYYPLYKYPLFKKMKVKKGNCEVTEKFYNNMISFPFHIWMSDRQFKYLINSTKQALIQLRR